MNKLITALLLVSLTPPDLYASLFTVGAGQIFTTPNQLYLANENGTITISSGDTIFIEAGLYEGTACLAVWHADSLLIRGINGRPHIKANGAYIWQKGNWVCAGDYITVENIEFSEASVPDLNGAGIRLDGIGLTARHCYFHDNENGILTSNPYVGHILVEFSEFDHNGYGDGYSHNIYVGHVESFTLRFCYMHHAYIGHNVKSRAENNYILYNRIMDEYTGQSSYLVNLPNGGFSLLIGNLLMQGTNAENKTLIDYGSEGLSNSTAELYVVNNTMINERFNGIFVSANTSSSIVKIVNNVMVGAGDLYFGATDTANNLHFADTIGLGLADPVNFDYHLKYNSPLINAGTNPGLAGTYSLSPIFEYVHPQDSAMRQTCSSIDVGAYEFPEPATFIYKVEKGPEILVYPNPARDFIWIENPTGKSIHEISLFSMEGKRLYYQENVVDPRFKVDVMGFPSGKYFFSAQTNKGYLQKGFIILD